MALTQPLSRFGLGRVEHTAGSRPGQANLASLSQRKLNAIADALADFMRETNVNDQQVDELRAAVGIEHRESTGAAQ